jgi:hypothetical protein
LRRKKSTNASNSKSVSAIEKQLGLDKKIVA